jgi:hypothetical protein
MVSRSVEKWIGTHVGKHLSIFLCESNVRQLFLIAIVVLWVAGSEPFVIFLSFTNDELENVTNRIPGRNGTASIFLCIKPTAPASKISTQFNCVESLANTDRVKDISESTTNQSGHLDLSVCFSQR